MGSAVRVNRKSWPRAPRWTLSSRVLRAGDIALAVTLLVLTAPLIGLAVVVMLCESRGPVLEAALDRGLGRRFRNLRLRTRGHDVSAPCSVAERTAVGQLLHYARINELPQLINVLRGDMSLIDSSRQRPGFLD
jgi:lipopolysaccharide/colanic/teichoic acid biosynthesis glycosyltransferase